MATAAGLIDFVTGAPVAGSLDVAWNHGAKPASAEPPIQVHAFDEHTFILRQGKWVSREAPFLYLFLGNKRALLLDTGATRDAAQCPVRETIDGILSRWLEAHPRDGYELVVAHTHGHWDHVAGDPQFYGRANTRIASRGLSDVQAFFGITGWPEQVIQFDLGGRILDIFGCPGHHPASIAVFDAWSGFLVTGDTVYPGRLYAPDFAAFVASLDRLTAFAHTHDVRHVMGCHNEMTTTPGRDYPLGARCQPNEPPIQMTVAQLDAVRDAAHRIADSPGVHRFDDFIIYNGPCRWGMAKLVARSAWMRLRGG
jgi:glyoxylase-like metal-dependent hydrolase (beta-lactamase superfamily II)